MADRVHRYEVRRPRVDWSVWLVDERTGTLTIFGDLETWSYSWGHAGRCDGLPKTDFRFELLSFDESYVTRKLSYGRTRELDEEATAKLCREEILRQRREQDIDAADARRLWGLTSNFAWQGAWFSELVDKDHEFSQCSVMRVVNQGQLETLMREHWPIVRANMARDVVADRARAWFSRNAVPTSWKVMSRLIAEAGAEVMKRNVILTGEMEGRLSSRDAAILHQKLYEEKFGGES